MGGILLGIQSAMQIADLLLGSEAAKLALGAWSTHFNLSPEQTARLEANHLDNVSRIKRLKAEIAEHDQKNAPPIRPA